jgi:hypothetical protein
MYWLVAALFLIGAACGATIRLMVFIVVLLGAGAVAIGVTISHGLARAILHAVIAVVVLQIGYAAGFALRAALRSRQASSPPRLERKPPVPAPLSEKRR